MFVFVFLLAGISGSHANTSGLKTKFPYTGLYVRDASHPSFLKKYNLPKSRKAVLIALVAKGPALNAGLKNQDIILMNNLSVWSKRFC